MSFSKAGQTLLINFKVAVFTFVEIFDEATTDFRSINHHGSRRKVFDTNATEARQKKNGYMLSQTKGDVAKFFSKYYFMSQSYEN